MKEHCVRLPHPAREGVSVGRCDCGWLVLYSWGEHGDAASTATEHIEQAERAEVIEVAEVCGDRMLLPGRSL